MLIRATRFQLKIIMSHKLHKPEIGLGIKITIYFNTFLDYHKLYVYETANARAAISSL